MKQTNAKKYGYEYYENAYGHSIYDSTLNYFTSKHFDIYKEIVNLVKIKPNDKVIDYGCGNGDLAFYLTSLNCRVTGIDYSKETIDICNEKLKKIKRLINIDFINCNNDSLPRFKNVKVVFFCDTIEHMYDEEITVVLEKIKEWNEIDDIQIAIHTDNANYLKFIKPFFDLMFIILKVKTIEQIKEDYNIEQELHVNLTTPRKLQLKMERLGYQQMILSYPEITKERVERQLGELRKIPFLTTFCLFLLKRSQICSPNFYALYKKR